MKAQHWQLRFKLRLQLSAKGPLRRSTGNRPPSGSTSLVIRPRGIRRARGSYSGDGRLGRIRPGSKTNQCPALSCCASFRHVLALMLPPFETQVGRTSATPTVASCSGVLPASKRSRSTECPHARPIREVECARTRILSPTQILSPGQSFPPPRFAPSELPKIASRWWALSASEWSVHVRFCWMQPLASR